MVWFMGSLDVCLRAFCFVPLLTPIDRASFPIPLSDWGWELIQPSLLAVLVVLREGVPEKSGATLEVQVPPGKGTQGTVGYRAQSGSSQGSSEEASDRGMSWGSGLSVMDR